MMTAFHFLKKSNNISWLNFYAHPRRISYDENVLSVYKKCTTDYLWLLANDDFILNSNVIIQIFNILDKYKPRDKFCYIFQSRRYNRQNKQTKYFSI